MTHIKIFNQYILLLLVTFLNSILLAQNPVAHTLTRGKMWLTGYEAKTTVGGEGGTNFTSGYPGYYWSEGGEHPNAFWGRIWHNGNGYFGIRDSVAITHHLSEHTYAATCNIIQENQLINNFNFESSLDLPEQYTYGIVETRSDYPVGTTSALQLRIASQRMVWSLPELDDFIIETITITNIDQSTITDFYWYYTHDMLSIYEGRTMGFNSDDEYIWASDLANFREEQGAFIFYDDTQIPQNNPDTPTEYQIPPGDETGDIGDPGNIRQQNSIDIQLYAPQVFADMIIDCTPNKYGIKNVYQNITATNNKAMPNSGFVTGTPDKERFEITYRYDQLRARLLTNQPRMSWDEASLTPSDSAGNVYERTPHYLMTIGPYDLNPGESIDILRVLCGGEMDRNISMRGGIEATQIVQQEGIANLKENWNAALKLIQNDFKPLEYPPPTPAETPLVGNENELIVQAFIDPNTVEQGFEIIWKPISDSYEDPIKNVNDFAGYKVYRSEQSVLGPWEEIADITKDESLELVDESNNIVFRYVSKPGIPMRFCVTSYDDDGNESGKSGYSFYPEAAKPTPANDFSKVRVVPNPFKQVSGLPDPGEDKRLTFINIPGQCTIKIFNVAGELIQTINHDDGFGEEAWGSSSGNNYMLNRFSRNVMPGIYIYHIESHVPGYEGQTATGKFAIIK